MSVQVVRPQRGGSVAPRGETSLLTAFTQVMGGVFTLAGRATGSALRLGASAVSASREAVRATEATALAAIESTRDVTLASLENSRNDAAALAALFAMALQGTQAIAHSAVAAQQSLTAKATEAFERARAALQRDSRDALLREMRASRNGFHAIRERPRDAQFLATQNLNRLDPSIRGFEAEIQREREEEEREREAEVSRSCNERIDLARRSIQQISSSLQTEQQLATSALFFVCIAPFVSAYFCSKPVTVGVTALSALFTTALYAHLKKLDAKRKWLEVYGGALNRLRSDHSLTVLSAVQQELTGDLTLEAGVAKAPETRNMLRGISSRRILGDPAEKVPTIPPELQSLIHAAMQPPHVFTSLETQRGLGALRVLRNPVQI